MTSVGERALAVVETNGFHLYRSQWAGSDAAVGRVCAATGDSQFDVLDGDWEYQRSVRPEQLSAQIDFLTTEAVYHINSTGIRVYQPIWLGFDSGGGTESEREPNSEAVDGLLVPIRTIAERIAVRAAVQWLKGGLYRAIWGGAIDRETARLILRCALVDR